jgi:hypothetical protein
VARIGGFLLLLATIVLAGVLAVMTISGSTVSEAADDFRYGVLVNLPKLLFAGFMALVLSEFISYLLAEQGEPKWILRHADKIIYAYVLYVTGISVHAMVLLHGVYQEIGTAGSLRECYIALALTLAFIVVRMLIWIGIAVVLRKVVPIVRESKTLV